MLITSREGDMMQLMTEELKREIPPLGATEEESDPVVRAKIFDPCSNWTWYVIEYDGEDICFGLVHGFADELGYFSLKELGRVQNQLGIGLERDRHFTPQPLSEIKKQLSGYCVE